MANIIRTVYLLDSYLSAAAQLNPLAVCSAARSLLELHAVLRYVEHLLTESCGGAQADWLERGQQYFNVILRSRFGTSDATAQHLFRSHGFPETALRPIKVKDARAFLGRELDWLDEHYSHLCDFVHPFMWGQQIVGSYGGESTIARTSNAGGAFVLRYPQTILQYKFPMLEAGRRALTKTATRALDNTRGIVKALKEFPRSPFSETELFAKTGSALGFGFISRNGRCYCGSGKKFRNCHGVARV